MNVIELLNKRKEEKAGTAFSFELLPPLKGTGIEKLFHTIEELKVFDPQYINITTHRSEYVYTDLGNGLLQSTRIRRRPGTVAVAAAIQQKFCIPVVPHVLCSGFTREETEYLLLDLQFLGISNILALRGDKAKEDRTFKPTEGGYSHTTELLGQINQFNDGHFIDGTEIKVKGVPFSYGVACYPEKHVEAPNMDTDLMWLKRKVELGAGYAVTQLFYDNAKYFDFVRRVRAMGIEIPIIPGIKPLTKLSQLTMVPQTFHCDMPEALTREAMKCKNDDEVRTLGVEWSVTQCRELMKAGVASIHFYTMSSVPSIKEIAAQIY
jgi:methylenetetrahydrofolate reductase (NADPH)